MKLILKYEYNNQMHDMIYRYAGKRVFDFVIAIFLITVSTPLMIIVSILVALGDGLPVVFKQTRVGQHNKQFKILKFRTMRKVRNQPTDSFDAGDSSRVTGVGRWLRATKVDELPQLFNVFKGDMSLVGPRPEIEKWTKVYPERWSTVLSVRPGITDEASIVYRNEEQILSSQENPEKYYRDRILPDKLLISEQYVEKQSLTADLKILTKTILKLMDRK